MFQNIRWTRFEQFPSSWRERTTRSVDHPLGRTGVGGDVLYYTPWQDRTIYKAAACSRTSASRIMPKDMNGGWVNDEDDSPCVPRNTSCNFVPRQVRTVVGRDLVYAGKVSPYFATAVEPALTMTGTDTTNDVNLVRIVREFLVDSGGLSLIENVISIVRMRAYVHGRCAR